uniref:Uncharacterized protein n=1 Tax=Alexandrium monilatum TaxID=311494 RepID=A0A7S4RW63_9DINO
MTAPMDRTRRSSETLPRSPSRRLRLDAATVPSRVGRGWRSGCHPLRLCRGRRGAHLDARVFDGFNELLPALARGLLKLVSEALQVNLCIAQLLAECLHDALCVEDLRCSLVGALGCLEELGLGGRGCCPARGRTWPLMQHTA